MNDKPKKINHIHFGGVGGCGISALAQIALSQGYFVTGSDVSESVYTKKLKEIGVPIFLGHRAENVRGADLVVNSAALEESNVEVAEAKKLKIPTLKHAQFLGQLMKDKYGICVAGTHGKTATDALVGLLLVEAGLDPTVEIGGTVPEFDGNIRVGNGKYFVAEACEFDRSFLNLFPKIGIVLNIEEDHPDYYPNRQVLEQAFIDFMNLVPDDGYSIIRVENENIREILHRVKSKAKRISVGFDKKCDWWAQKVRYNSDKTKFEAFFRGKSMGEFSLLIPGWYNVQSALVALAVAQILGINYKFAKRVFKAFTGVGRRFEIVSCESGVTVINDYAHHPSQIAATISAAKQKNFQRLVVVFQPHTYSRTKYLFHEFVHAFLQADAVFIADTYIPAGRHEVVLNDFSSEVLAKEIGKLQPNVSYSGDLKNTEMMVRSVIKPGDGVLILGAGDVNKIKISNEKLVPSNVGG